MWIRHVLSSARLLRRKFSKIEGLNLHEKIYHKGEKHNQTKSLFFIGSFRIVCSNYGKCSIPTLYSKLLNKTVFLIQVLIFTFKWECRRLSLLFCLWQKWVNSCVFDIMVTILRLKPHLLLIEVELRCIAVYLTEV